MKQYLFSSMGAVVLTICLAAGLSAAMYPPTANSAPVITSFTVAHPALRPGERTSLRVLTGENDPRLLTYSWTAEAGDLNTFADDHAEWTAPQREGRYLITARVTNASGAMSSASVGIIVSDCPPRTLIMSVDPVTCQAGAQ